MTNEKINSLSKFLGVNPEEIEVSSYDKNIFEYGREEYLVLTDSEADERAKEQIEESLWAFNTDFILDHSNFSEWNERTEKAFRKMQSELCEDANEIVKAIITDMDEFVSDAISADGRGHFLAGYDGEENEQDEFYIYRTN